jgi:2-oxoglutarate ferredoxin oxidoreductase subunit alpha
VERIFRKIDRHLDEIVMFEEDGLEDARIVIIAYGGTARSARHAIKLARGRYGRKVGMLRLKTLWPFPEAEVERACENAQRVIVPEMNLGQVALEVERMVGYKKVTRVGRADGHLVTPEQILDAIRLSRPHASWRFARAYATSVPVAPAEGQAGVPATGGAAKEG